MIADAPRPFQNAPIVRNLVFFTFGLILLYLLFELTFPIGCNFFGKSTVAVVAGQWMTTQRNSSYFLKVDYQDSGRPQSSVVIVGKSAYYLLKPGDKTGVHYFEFWPDQASIDLDVGDRWVILFFFLTIGIIFFDISWSSILKSGR